jgi:hypothetical protein
MSLVVTCVCGGILNRLDLDWIHFAKGTNVLIAYDPGKDFSQEPFFGQPTVLREWGGHKWYFSVPQGVEVQPTDKWASDSNGRSAGGVAQVTSQMLYPWHWNLDGYDIVCQIAPPRSESSRNHHLRTTEYFFPAMNNEKTFLLARERESCLSEGVVFEPGVSHQLVNRGDGFSAQLLKMIGPYRFPSREDHHYGGA